MRKQTNGLSIPSFLLPKKFTAAAAWMLSVLITGTGQHINAQTTLPLQDLSAFANPAPSWRIAGAVAADLQKDNILNTTPGQGVLVNLPSKKVQGADLYTKDSFSDFDLELDYMMARNSNSGIYMMSRYELQLRDSWGVQQVAANDNGGIYQQWDEQRGKGREGYGGHAPRQNVSRAPGLWQHLKVSFQAPRFDASGNKIQNARILSVELNGVLIHDNVELLGVTRGAADNKEVASAPLRIQGDHGVVAFRNIVLTPYNAALPTLTNLKYQVYYGKYETAPDFDTLKADDEGSVHQLTSAVIKRDNDFLARYTGTLNINTSGEYRFVRETHGAGQVTINGQVVSSFANYDTKPIRLEPGQYPFELIYTKSVGWLQVSLGLTVSAPGIREYLISDINSLHRNNPDPILVEANSPTVLRSFMDIPNGKRVVHAVNVGHPSQLHYTYDLDNGTLVQAWRGRFLNVTPMWHDRGDGSSRPMGSRIVFGTPHLSLIRLSSAQDTLSSDTTGTGYTPRGYELNNEQLPTFLYDIYGVSVRDAITPGENGRSLRRNIQVAGNPGNLYFVIAEGSQIAEAGKGWYTVDDQKYYLNLQEAGIVPEKRQLGSRSVLLVPVKSSVTYSIVF